MERLDTLVALLDRWTPRINLVARSTLPEVWRRHVLDSAQLVDLAPPSASTWVDLGSGAGFPGLIVALIAAMERPALRVTLVESDARKSAFLREALRATGVSATVLTSRAESGVATPHDVVSARALAPLARLVALAAPWMHSGSVALFPKGAGHRGELTAAAQGWHSEIEVLPSLADPDGVVLKLTEVRRAHPG